MKRPYYIADINRKRVKETGAFAIDHNAIQQARELMKQSGQTTLVMREGIVVREILAKTRLELMDDEIAATERKLQRLKVARADLMETAND